MKEDPAGSLRSRQIKADLAMLMVALIWGLTFVSVKNALTGITPFMFVTLRFGIAFAFLGLVYCRRWKNLNGPTLLAGLLIGLFLFAGYAFQTFGLQFTTASNAGFITGLSVVLVPILSIFITRKPPTLFAALGVAAATIGLGLLSLGDNFTLNQGDLLVLGCAVAYALHIMLVGRYAPRFDTVLLAVVQIGTVAVASGLLGVISEPTPRRFNEAVWVGLLITAIPATSLAFLIQNYMQKFTSPTRTAIILTMEPVFALMFGYLLLGESLTVRGLTGCAFVLAGMLVSELKSGPKVEVEADGSPLQSD